MAIIYENKTQVFSLHTKNTTYQLQAADHGVLLHLYYGKRLSGNMDYLIQRYDVGFSGNPYDAGEDRTFSLDTLPQEFPSDGVGDYRTSCIGIQNADGTRAADFRYRSFQITDGAMKIPGMPALYEEDGEGKEAKTLEIQLEDAASRVRAVLFYTVFEEKDIIARTVKIINGGKAGIVLERLLSACLDLPYGDWEFVHFHGRHAMERLVERTPLIHGSLKICSKRGTSSHQNNPSIILCSPDATETAGSCYGMALVYSGNFIAEAEMDQISQVRAVMGINPEQFSYVLDEGTEFYAPQVIYSYTDGGFETLSHNFHRILRSNLCRGKYKRSRRPVLINNWEATYFDFTREKLISIAKQAAEVGIEMLVLDDGWFGKRESDYSGLGDWFVNQEKLGGTLDDLVKEVNGLGLKFGIWVEPEMVSEDSNLYRSHPDWALQIPGRAPCRGRYQLVLDMSRADVRDYLFDRLSGVLDSANIEYVKWDMNRSMCDIYSGLLNCGHQGEVYHRCILGVYELLERLVTAYPDLLLEGCSGGGGRFDPAMLYYFPQIWCSDDSDAIERLEIQYGTSFFYPVSTVGAHVSASPNHQTGRETPVETRSVVAMAGTFGYELDLNLLAEDERQKVREQISDFKKYYDVIQNGWYYRLSSPYGRQRVTSWLMVSEDKNEALLSLVCTHVRANENNVFVKLRGLDPGKNYKIEGLKALDGIYSGSMLMYGGISLPLLYGNYPARQLHLTAV